MRVAPGWLIVYAFASVTSMPSFDRQSEVQNFAKRRFFDTLIIHTVSSSCPPPPLSNNPLSC
jgi:hypothetical protein